MNYQAFFEKIQGKAKSVGIIGSGHYATAIVTQCRYISSLEVKILADIELDHAIRAYRHAGYTKNDFRVCSNRDEALAALKANKKVIVQDPLIMMDLPIDIVVEATGFPEAGALHAHEAIKNGKHVAMVTKEVDVTIGPILKYLAERQGLVYTAVDGDQHGLLIKLIAWVRSLGLEVLCGGKSIEFDLILDEEANRIGFEGEHKDLRAEDIPFFKTPRTEKLLGHVARRKRVLGDFGSPAGYDITEMTIAGNATGLRPDIPELHCPVLRIPEIPEVLAPREVGGLLNGSGILECFTCLRSPWEAGMGGGEFVVVSCDNAYSRNILISKGLLSNQLNNTALIYQPYHLCGVETPLSLILATHFGIQTGALQFRQSYDMVAKTTKAFKKGQTMGTDKSRDLKAYVVEKQSIVSGALLPFQLGRDNPFGCDIPEGTPITTEMIQRPQGSILWELRERQDQMPNL